MHLLVFCEAIMKKNLTLLFILSVVILFANPIEPVFINELYFEDGDWTLEIYDYYAFSFFSNLDNCYLKSSTDSVYFNDGITWNENFIFVVDENDMQNSFAINPNGDEIMFVNEQEDIYDQISFGMNVNPPFAGQSLVRIHYYAGPPMYEEYFLLVKENQPSIGYDPFSVSSYGTFTGYVFDSLQNPVENVQLESYSVPEIMTDENGYFNADLPGMNYNFNVHLLYLATIDTIVTIEPDSLNYYEFVFENYVSSDDIEIEFPSSYYNLTNYPNPFNPTTEISFESTNLHKESQIEIYNSRGQKLKTISLSLCHPETVEERGETKYNVVWDGTNETGKQVPSGVYLYKLVSNEKELAANKMLLLK